MSDLFPKATILNMVNKVDYSAGGVVSKQVLKNEVGNITLFSFDKGQGLTEHTAPYDALVEVLDGMVEIKIDGSPLKLQAGDSIIIPANVPHALFAVERFKMLLTMIKG